MDSDDDSPPPPRPSRPPGPFWWWHDRLWLTLVAPLTFGISAMIGFDAVDGTGLSFTLTLVAATMITEYFVRNIARLHGSTLVVMFLLAGSLVGLNVRETFAPTGVTRGFPVPHHGEISLMVCDIMFGYLIVFGYATLAEVWIISRTKVPEAEQRAVHAQSTMSQLKEAKRAMKADSETKAAEDADGGSVGEKR